MRGRNRRERDARQRERERERVQRERERERQVQKEREREREREIGQKEHTEIRNTEENEMEFYLVVLHSAERREARQWIVARQVSCYNLLSCFNPVTIKY